MTTHVFIAGHGKNKDGSFDSGATGYIKQGEHWYFENVLFPEMKKYVPEGQKISWITSYNVYNHGDLVSLAKKYGADTMVTEYHYDAATATSAKGGHVIVKNSFPPDQLDIKLRDAIAETVGINSGYVHKNYKGISGRGDLANVNRAAAGGVNYRLIELGFGTNYNDANYMMNNKTEIAKAFVKAYFGKIKETTTTKGKGKLFKVQTGAFSNKANAVKMQAELKKKGYETIIVEE